MINTNKKYPKTKNIYKKDATETFTSEWVVPEWKPFYDAKWGVYEKVDGANIRVIWDGEKIFFRARTNNGRILPHLLEYLEATFEDPSWFQENYPDGVILFGEGFGKKIQGVGSLYLGNDVGFCMFDAFTNIWLPQERVTEIAEELKLYRAPKIGEFSLRAVEGMMRNSPRLTSKVGLCPTYCEGVVCRLLNEDVVTRAVVKLKYKDYRK